MNGRRYGFLGEAPTVAALPNAGEALRAIALYLEKRDSLSEHERRVLLAAIESLSLTVVLRA